MHVAGLISGTSMDGIDVAAVEVSRKAEGIAFELLAYECTPYERALRAAIEGRGWNAKDDCTAQISSLNFEIGEAFAEAAVRMQQRIGDINLIGSHGQTVFHEPRPEAGSGRVPSTLQLGEPAVIAGKTGTTVVADFRVADVAAGGQGAPLVSLVDYFALRSPSEMRVALNIGGIANVTILPAGCSPQDVRAFDTGPGNALIDRAVRSFYPSTDGFDRDGEIAASGAVNRELLAWLLEDPYFAQPAPKTTGKERFSAQYSDRAAARAAGLGCSNNDFVATLTELTARTIAASVPKDCRMIIVSGGGAHNRTLISALERNLRDGGARIQIVRSDAFGLSIDGKEAMAFAILAYETIQGRCNNLPRATGARTPAIMGKIVPGENYATLMRSIWRSGRS
jgi:anhydro-N-acetylmuramic acid kinase